MNFSVRMKVLIGVVGHGSSAAFDGGVPAFFGRRGRHFLTAVTFDSFPFTEPGSSEVRAVRPRATNSLIVGFGSVASWYRPVRTEAPLLEFSESQIDLKVA